MEKVIYSDEVKIYLYKLVIILHKKEYFGYKATAKEYVDRITTDIETHIDIKRHKPTSPGLRKYGKYYASFPANKRTTWYVIFNKRDGLYNINYITNNHVGKAADLKRLS